MLGLFEELLKYETVKERLYSILRYKLWHIPKDKIIELLAEEKTANIKLRNKLYTVLEERDMFMINPETLPEQILNILSEEARKKLDELRNKKGIIEFINIH